MWLFGQLDTLGDSKVQEQTDETAKIVSQLLQQLAESQNVVGQTNATTEHATTNEPPASTL